MEQDKSQADELVMTLVELALSRPEIEHEAYLRSACGANTQLFNQVWSYIQWEKRMNGFLLDPLHPRGEVEHRFEPGEVLLGRFRIVREIAQGGMGVVCEAIDEKLDRRVALKSAKSGFGKQLPPEVRNARDISHPNVCKIFEIHTVSTEQGTFDFIVMEFLQGVTLAERLKRGSMPKSQARSIALQLCAGVAEAHRNGVIHGDLKSNNVILTIAPDGAERAVITDFGLARRPGSKERGLPSAVLAGTPEYMAPELWKGQKASIASDIYALGVILWEIFVGGRPNQFAGNATTLTWDQRFDWRPPEVRGKQSRVLARCLDPDPERRFKSAVEIGAALGPTHVLQWSMTAAAAVVLAAAVGFAAWEEASGPQETVKLALLPFAAPPGAAELPHQTGEELGRLRGNKQTRLKVISPEKVASAKADTAEKARSEFDATHVLRVSWEPTTNGVKLMAAISDARTGVDSKVWKAEYRASELRFVPIALAAVVTGTLHLPPPMENATVNAAAKKDYDAGLEAVRRDSGVDEALAHFRTAVERDPDSPLTWAGLAEAEWFEYFLKNNRKWREQAAEAVRLAEQRNPDLGQVHRVSGLLKVDASWYEEAVNDYRRAVEINAADGDAYRRLAMALVSLGKREDALTNLKKATDVDSLQYRNFLELGKEYLQFANYKLGSEAFKKAVQLSPNEPRTHFGLGVAYRILGNFDLAERELRRSLELRETAPALDSLGLTLISRGEAAQAVPVFLRSLQLSSSSHLRWMNLGTAYRLAGRVDEAHAAYRRALDLAEQALRSDPRDAKIRSEYAYLFSQLGDRGRAKSELAQSLQQSPNDAETKWMAVATYESLGDRDDSLKVLSSCPPGVVDDLSRWPDLAALRNDPRFKILVNSQTAR